MCETHCLDVAIFDIVMPRLIGIDVGGPTKRAVEIVLYAVRKSLVS